MQLKDSSLQKRILGMMVTIVILTALNAMIAASMPDSKAPGATMEAGVGGTPVMTPAATPTVTPIRACIPESQLSIVVPFAGVLGIILLLARKREN